MQKLFKYNWQVRRDWFEWCESVDEQELLKSRIGGPGSILYTLFHIVDVEHSWIRGLQGKIETEMPPFEECASVQKLRDYSERCHAEIAPFILAWNSGMENQILSDKNDAGEWEKFRYGEIMRHVLAHEIHHIGQLSVWSRELGKGPITANLIRRGLFDR
ncbi:DinB family protein [Paenibacillus herberti]|uniref:Damage-inducible protein DinB n=1 Tax=Paenibacillus herberti TaxID=1619309 RepID=A0A229P2L8_9BACL|nr:DinB family protein [Paenibacillus herberti]OXM16340.1 damage-inducible protein DinB [Paenibacillus herberti]